MEMASAPGLARVAPKARKPRTPLALHTPTVTVTACLAWQTAKVSNRPKRFPLKTTRAESLG